MGVSLGDRHGLAVWVANQCEVAAGFACNSFGRLVAMTDVITAAAGGANHSFHTEHIVVHTTTITQGDFAPCVEDFPKIADLMPGGAIAAAGRASG